MPDIFSQSTELRRPKQRWFVFVSHEGERNLNPYQTEKDIELSKAHPDVPTAFHVREKITPNGQRVIFYNEKHALAYGNKMKEYLGMVDIEPGNSEDVKIIEMTADEIRMLNLPKNRPREAITKTVVTKQGTMLWSEYFGNKNI